MRKKELRTVVLFFGLFSVMFVVGAADGQAQDDVALRFPVHFKLGTYSQLGFENPYVSFGAGGEVDSRAFLGRFGGSFSPSNKIETGDGYSWSVSAEAYAKIHGHFLFGGGGRHGFTQTSRWRKGSTRPFLGGGAEFRAGNNLVLRGLFRYLLSGTDRANHLRGPEIGLEMDFIGGGKRRNFPRIGFNFANIF